jgi:branched-subunit amino acid transport protein
MIYLYIAVMAGSTYLIRMLPLVLIRKKIHSKFILSFLCYVPYAVLGAMTIPDIFYAAGNRISAVAAAITAAVLAFQRKSLLVVAIAASATAFLTNLLILAFA